MFAKRLDGSALCIADYKDIKAGAIVPVSNELYTQVEESVAESGWQTLPEGWTPPKPPMTLEQFKNKVQQELDKNDACAIRWAKLGIAFADQTTWVDYDKALRVLMAEDTVKDIPAQPDYPAGT